MKLFGYLASVLFFFATAAPAAQFNASTSGNDDNPCTPGATGSAAKRNPFSAAGLQSCSTQPGGPHTLFIEAGTYTSSAHFYNLGAGMTNPPAGTIFKGAGIGQTILRSGTGGLLFKNINNGLVFEDFTLDCENVPGAWESACFKIFRQDSLLATGLTLRRMRIEDSVRNLVQIFSLDNYLIEDSILYNVNTGNAVGGDSLALYSSGQGHIFRRNVVTGLTLRTAGVRISPNFGDIGVAAHPSKNNLIEKNIITMRKGHILIGGGVNSFDATGNIVRENILLGACGEDGASTGNPAILLYQPQFGTKIEKNTIYMTGGCVNGISVPSQSFPPGGGDGFVRNTEIENNLIIGATTAVANNGVGTTQAANLTSNPGFINPAGGDLCLAATATNAINQGLADASITHNGSAPDIGACETFTHGQGTVSGNTMDITLAMAPNQPLRPATGITGFTVNNGRNVTSAVRISNTIVRLTFDGPSCVSAQSWTYSYSTSTGNVTDSAAIGGTQNQRLNAITNQSVTNLCQDSVPPPGPTVKYADPTGSGSTCSSGTPCSLSTLRSQLVPGDTGLLKDGTYSGSGTVLLLDATPGTGTVVDGTQSSPITIRAENPGMALLQGDGTAGEVLRMVNLDWWTIEHLRVENQDNPAYTGSSASVIYCSTTAPCNDLIIRKNIVRKPNTYGNNHPIHMTGDRNTVCENDVLKFHRNGIVLFGTGTENNEVCLNYAGQSLPDLSAGGDGPNDFFVAYDAPNNTWSNNIAESVGDSGVGANIGFTGWASGNKYYDNICSGLRQSCMALAATASVTTGANNYIVDGLAAIGPAFNGIYLKSPFNASVTGVLVHTSTTPDRAIILDDSNGVPTTTATIRNAMAVGTTGYVATSIDALTLSDSHGWPNSPTPWGSGTSGRTNSPPLIPGDVDPLLGDCRVSIPVTSPFKGRGFGGADIGANVLYVTVNGVRTTQRLWDHTLTGADRGKMLFGPAVIAGVNDSSTGEVRSTVHQRIGFGTGGCAFPSNYVGSNSIYRVTVFRWESIEGPETAPFILPYPTAANSTHITAPRGAEVRYRAGYQCENADCPATGVILKYNVNGGFYTDQVPDAAGSDDLQMIGNAASPYVPQELTPTTRQITTGGTFRSTGFIRSGASALVIDLAQNDKGETVHGIKILETATPGDRYCFRLYSQDGVALTNDVSGCVTVTDLVAGY